GRRLLVSGPDEAAERVVSAYRKGAARSFDAEIMSRIYERPFEAVVVAEEEIPEERSGGGELGGHLQGCRIGFDLGASDYKIAAVRDGNVLFSEEIPWNPGEQQDPSWHLDRVHEGLERAAAHLPRVDAIGGSSAGVVVDYKLMVASLLRSVPPERMDEGKSIFLELRRRWNVPLEVRNDGEVTALAARLSLGAGGVLGIAMGSSEAAGYVDSGGRMESWLNELACSPVDLSPNAPRDEWSGDVGVGALYFSQQAVSRLMPPAGLPPLPGETLPERLARASTLATEGDERARRIFETIGAYLGHTLPWYSLFYDMTDVQILGRVTSGEGGRIIKARAEAVLSEAYPEAAAELVVHLPDEKSRRVGQAVAAASLPPLSRHAGDIRT
ncbi:MAG: ROK family protein, partial [Myxococcota bacterium]